MIKAMSDLKKEKSLTVQAIKTRLFEIGGDLANFIVEALSSYTIKEKTVLVVTSKLFSLAERRVIQTKDKVALIKKEADHYIGKGAYDFHLTIKEGLLMPSAGIDQSNSPTGEYLLLPKNPYASLKKLGIQLKEKLKVSRLGLLMTDSHTTPLRRGVTGVGLAHWGFKAVKDLRGKEDLYKRKLNVTTINNVDALSSMAVWVMGEGADGIPMVLIENAILEWDESSSEKEIRIPIEEDLYSILLKGKI